MTFHRWINVIWVDMKNRANARSSISPNIDYVTFAIHSHEPCKSSKILFWAGYCLINMYKIGILNDMKSATLLDLFYDWFLCTQTIDKVRLFFKIKKTFLRTGSVSCIETCIRSINSHIYYYT